MKNRYSFVESTSPILQITYSKSLKAFVIIREDGDLQFIDHVEQFLKMSKGDLFNISEIGIDNANKSKSRVVQNLIHMLKEFSKINFRSFNTKYLSQISKASNLPTERQKYSAEMPKYITPEEVCRKYKIGEHLSISIRPILGVYYDKGIVILKRDRRADIFIMEPEMFHVLVPSDFQYCLEKKWICLKAEDGNNLEDHMKAFNRLLEQSFTMMELL